MTSFSLTKSQQLHTCTDPLLAEQLLGDPEVDVNYRQSTTTDVNSFHNVCYLGCTGAIKAFLKCDRAIDFNPLEDGECAAVFHCLQYPEKLKMLADDERIDLNLMFGGGRNILHCSRERQYPLESYKILLACYRLDPALVPKRDNNGRDAKEVLVLYHNFECADLLDAYAKDPRSVRLQLREELGYTPADAGELFATVVLLCDDYLKIKEI